VQPVATGNQTATFGSGNPCRPKVVLFFYNNMTADGGTAGAAFGFGAAVSPTQRMAGFSNSADALNTSNTNRALSQTRAVVIINSSQTIVASADMVTLNTDGFTLNWDVVDANARIINYLAIGGTDVTNATVGSYTAAGSAQNVTGLGFQPDLVILYFTGPSTGGSFTQTIGFATAVNSWSIATSSADASALASTFRLQRTGKSFHVLGSAGIANTECTTAMITDGFTQTCSTQGNLSTQYVAIKGGSYKLGSFSAPTSSGAGTITGVGFTPTALLLASYGATAFTTPQAHNRASWGAGTSSTNRWAIWHGDTNGPTVMVASQFLNRSAIFETRTEAGASPTALASADLAGFSSGAFTLNWAADAVAREILYLAIRTTEPAPPAITFIPPRIIRQ